MSIFWISIAILFTLFLYFEMGGKGILEFFTGYLLEKSLSVDNLFVFMLLFTYFKTPKEQIHKVLFWGVIGAILMRAHLSLQGLPLSNNFTPYSNPFRGIFDLCRVKIV